MSTEQRRGPKQSKLAAWQQLVQQPEIEASISNLDLIDVVVEDEPNPAVETTVEEVVEKKPFGKKAKKEVEE